MLKQVMQNKQIYYRLTALWVICEAMLGGIIHGLKLPVSGLIVGGSAVMCVCMIAYYYPVRGAILKATIIVAIFKMMLSPQSPLPAYVAVFFQGLIAELIFLNKKSFRLNCILFCVIAMLESGVQRLLIMTIFFGMDIWNAINIFINGITGQKSVTNYSYYLAMGYVSLHFAVGFIIGWYSGLIPSKMKKQIGNTNDLVSVESDETIITNVFQKSKKRKWTLVIIWTILVLMFIYSTVFPERTLIPSNIILKLLLRSLLIILTWIVLVNPILIRLLHKWLERKKAQSESEIREIAILIPVTQLLIVKSWELSSRKRGIKRIPLFLKIVVFNSLQNG
jgi:ABC-type thiamin/hydroxymethylpyrimidine transport system permease subunit